MPWNAVYFHQVSEHIDGIFGPDTPCHMNRQTFPGVFIDHHHQLDRTTVVGAVEHEVPRPDMVPMIRPQPDTGTVVQPRFGCLEGTFSPSRCQIRITRPWLTSQPCDLSKA